MITRERWEHFLIGLLAALLVPLASALVTVDAQTFEEPGTWARSLVTGVLVALGLYLRQFAAGPRGDGGDDADRG